MSDDADFTVRLIDQITSPGRAATITIKTIISATEDLDKALQNIDDAMAHQNWVAFKRGQQEADKLAASTKRLEDEFKKMDDAMDHQKWVGMKRGEAAMDRVAHAGKVGGVSLDALAQASVAAEVAVVAAAAAVAVGFVAITAHVGEASVEAGMFAQRSTKAISQLTGGVGDAEQTFDDVRHMAADLGLEVHATQEAFQHFLAMQFTPEGAKDLIKLGADLQSIGTSAEQVQSVFHQLATIKSFGKLQQGTLTNLAQAGVSEKLVIEALGESLHKTPAQIQKDLASGAIKADEGIEAIKTAIMHKTHEHALGDAGAAFAATTLEGMQQKFKSGIDNVFIDIGKAILPELVSIGESVTAIVGRIVESGKLDQMKDGFILVFHAISRFVEDNMPAIEKVANAVIEGIVFALHAMAAAIDFVANHWEVISTVLKGAGIALAVIGGILAVLAAGLMTLILAGPAAIAAIVVGVGMAIDFLIGLWPKIIDGIVAVETAIVSAIGAVISFISGGDAFAAAFQWAANLIDGLVQGIESFAGAALEKVTGFADSVVATFKSALGIASPSKLFEEAGVFTVEGFIKGITANDNAIQGATADMATSALAGADVRPSGGQGGPGGIGDIHIPITVNDVQDTAKAEEIGKTIGIQVRREVESIFDKLQATGTD